MAKDVGTWISELGPATRPIAQALRDLVLGVGPDLRESIKWGNPVYEMHDKVLYISAMEAYVSLGFFDGASLTDPQSRIDGTGKRMRHVKVRALGQIDREQFEAWIKEAIALDAGRST